MLCGSQLRGGARPKAHEVGRELGQRPSQAGFCSVRLGRSPPVWRGSEGNACAPLEGQPRASRGTPACAANELGPSPEPAISC